MLVKVILAEYFNYRALNVHTKTHKGDDMATIRKLPSGNYQAIIRLTGLNPIRKTFNTKRDATTFVREVEGNAKLSNTLGNPTLCSTTLASLIDDYVAQYTGRDNAVCGKADHDGKRKGGRLGWWKDEYGNRLLKDFTADTVREGIKKLLKQVKSQTTNRFKANLSSVFEFARDERWIKDNPCHDVKAKPEPEGNTRYFTPEEQQRQLNSTKNSTWDRLHLLTLFALKTGARKSEIENLTWDKINFVHSSAHLVKTKNGRQRVLPLTDDVMTELKRFRGIGLIFPSDKKHYDFDGKPMQKPFDFRKPWIRATDDAGVEGLGIHTCRYHESSSTTP